MDKKQNYMTVPAALKELEKIELLKGADAYQYLPEAEDEFEIKDTSLTFVRRRRPNDLLECLAVK